MRLESLLLRSPGELGTTPSPFNHKGIIILLHGLAASAESFRSEAVFRALELRLANLGWAVHVPSITGDGPGQVSYLQSSFGSNDSGSVELASILSQWETWVTDARAAALGDDLPVVLGGISWGGLYAIQIAGSGATRPDGVFVHVPALDPNALTEFNGYGLSALGTFNEAGMVSAPSTPRVPTLISYATNDTRVGYTVAESLAASIGADTEVYSTLGHTTDYAVDTMLVEWVESQTF